MSNPISAATLNDRYRTFLAANTLALPGREYPTFQLERFSPAGIESTGEAPTTFGKRAEFFFKTAIQQHPRYTLVADNIQLFEGKRTIGELDFILFDQQEKQHLHVELATKFYVYDPTIDGDLHSRWIGPNRKDTFLQKSEKLAARQFPLIFHPAFEKHALRLGLKPEDLAQKCCFKAHLYLPYHQPRTIDEFGIDAPAGYYLNLEAFKKQPTASSLYFLPEKKDWMCSPAFQGGWNHEETVEQITQMHRHQKAPLVWKHNPDGTTERFFVVWW